MFILGSSLVFYPRGIGKVLGAEILIKVLLSILIHLAVLPTLYGTTLQPYGCVPARGAPFYVLRLILKVGTFGAQYSECVPSHSFTLVFYPRGIGKVQREGILRKSIKKPTPNNCSMNVHSGHPIERSSSPIQGREVVERTPECDSGLINKDCCGLLYYIVCYFEDDVAEFGWSETVETLTVSYNANTAHLYGGRGE